MCYIKAYPRELPTTGTYTPPGTSASLVASLLDDGSDNDPHPDPDPDCCDAQQHIVMTLPGGEEVIIEDGNREAQDGQPGSSQREVNQEGDLGLGYPGSNRHQIPGAPPITNPINISPGALANSNNDDEYSQRSVANGKGKGKAPVREPPNHSIRPTAAVSVGESGVARPDDTYESAASGKSNKPLAAPVGESRKRKPSLSRSARSRFRSFTKREKEADPPNT